MVLCEPQPLCTTWNSTEPRRYKCLFHQCLDMMIIVMLILGEIFQAIEDLNKNHKNTISSSIRKVLDKSIIAWCLHTNNNFGAPKRSFIKIKSEPLGMEFQYIWCTITGIILCLYIQRNKLNEALLCYRNLKSNIYLYLLIYSS